MREGGAHLPLDVAFPSGPRKSYKEVNAEQCQRESQAAHNA